MPYKLGLDVGSTTAKLVIADPEGKLLFSRYERHHAQVDRLLERYLEEAVAELGDAAVQTAVTGSVGMGTAERLGAEFVQEVVAATQYVRHRYPQAAALIDIGGEDAKVVLFDERGTDLRMNGNCAGGTGAFIDQMALLLGVEVPRLSELALQAERIHPIAARCGVFSKTDVQNLVSRNVPASDIAASIFHAVAVQTVVTLSRGCTLRPPLLLCGGPLTFLPALRKAFADYLGLSDDAFLLPDHGALLPALGCARHASGEAVALGALLARLRKAPAAHPRSALPALFADEEEYAAWRAQKAQHNLPQGELHADEQRILLGIDSGSTTTKLVAADTGGRILFTHYAPNLGNPIDAVRRGLEALQARCTECGTRPLVAGSCSTGYGEELIRAAFALDDGIIETMAHYRAARALQPDVSFILDIGGQDMKAIFVERGAVTRMELNEACSSGCGSFIETFARSLERPVEEFARMACLAQAPCDLGTRCTVFMNSKVKQVLREGASLADIAAGLSYSVVKNCLYKVLKLRDRELMGPHPVVQGGTMRNDAVVRAFERLSGHTVARSDRPELMGAYGCALHAADRASADAPGRPLDALLRHADYTTRQVRCHGCENNCYVCRYDFPNGNVFYSGNKCERVFSNRGADAVRGLNLYDDKLRLLFGGADEGSGTAQSAREASGSAQNLRTVRDTSDTPQNLRAADGDRITRETPCAAQTRPAGKPRHARSSAPAEGLLIGLPRALNLYEEYPFWQTLLHCCGLRTMLSEPSTYARYEGALSSVMSDNICFPAKLVHSHIRNLAERGANRILMPYVVYERKEDPRTANSYNCPIVTGYSDVVRSAMQPDVPVDSPVVTFADEKLLAEQCAEYLSTLGVARRTAREAVRAALDAQRRYADAVRRRAEEIRAESRRAGRLTILLAGRPYHADPLVQHKLSEMIAALGADVITDDIVRGDAAIALDRTHLVTQWAYMNRILKAAEWAARQGDDVHFVQMTSFGCGPDAFLLDEVRDTLHRHGKPFTLLKIDDVNNIGSLRLRVRSLVESLRYAPARGAGEAFRTTRRFTPEDRRRKILVPYFSEYISPLLPALFGLAGYDIEVLPPSDAESAEIGLKYANNEVCYPATLVVGDLVRALQSGRYDLQRTAVAISQTGGQCRATNYVALIKRAMLSAGFAQVPVVTLGLGGSAINDQEGFEVPWRRVAPMVLCTILYADTLSKLYHATVCRERTAGSALRLRDDYLRRAQDVVAADDREGLLDLARRAAGAFDALIGRDEPRPGVGIVGEIFLKFNSYAHQHLTHELIARRIEVVPPTLLPFFLQSFVNHRYNRRLHLERSRVPGWAVDALYWYVRRWVRRFNDAAATFRRWRPFGDIHVAARHAEGIVSPAAQFGEGWLLPAEVAEFVHDGCRNVISLQPFGCIANHVISKGIEKRLKERYPDLNLLSLDFDGGVSEVNVMNRLLLFINDLK